MGILLEKYPTPREPVILINEPYRCGQPELSDAAFIPRPPWVGDLTVDIKLQPGVDRAEAGTAAYVFCSAGEPAAVWVSDPVHRRLGQLIGPGSEIVTNFICSAYCGLRAVVAYTEFEDASGTMRVQIPGAEPRE